MNGMTRQNRTMTVTILGSGTCVPSLERSSCSLLVETGRSKILLDCGPGTMRRLLEAGATVHEITHLFFSHFHPDHTGEMASFLFANRYVTEPGRKFPLVMAGGRGFVLFYGAFKKAYGTWIELPDNMLETEEFSTTGPDTKIYDDFSISTMPVSHNPESVAFRITAGTKSIVYSGDTDESNNLVALARNADMVIYESSMPDGLKVDGHLTPSLAGKMAKMANAGELVLTHFYPPCDKADIKQQCRSEYGGPIRIAKDLMKIEL